MISVVLALAAATPAVDPENVVRCVRETVTGSLSRTRRVCHTVGEWRTINRDASREADRVIMPNGVPTNGPK